MPDSSDALPGATPSNYQRTTGGNLRWKPPTVEHLQELLPQYEIILLLGHGGMGAVYKGRQISLDRLVAIKILPPEAAGDGELQFVERFKNEARTMAKMNHPAIVSVYDFGETREGQLYIVMEFVDGTDVSKMILSQGKLPPEYALAITAHVCDALQYAHTHGVIHRDIKPANILINMEGAVKVADFGLAKAADASQGGLTKTNVAMGTPDFVAPEALIAGINVDGRADLYAVGVMLYNMLTGNIPRGMFRMPSVMLKTDPRFDQIIMKSMEMDREMRYQTAYEIRRDLDVILTTPQVEAGGQSSAAIPKQHLPQKPVARGPQKPMGKSAQVPVRTSAKVPVRSTQADAGTAGGEAESPGSVSGAAKKSLLGPIIGIAATIIIGGGLVFMLKKPSPPPAQAAIESGNSASTPVKVVANPPTTKTTARTPAPLSSPGAAPAERLPLLPEKQKLDLIALLDPVKDRLKAEGLAGANQWERTKEGYLKFTPTDGKSGKIGAPVSLRGVRDFELSVIAPGFPGAGIMRTLDIPFSKEHQGTFDFTFDGPIQIASDENGQRKDIGRWPQSAHPSSVLAVRVRFDANGETGVVEVLVDGNLAGSWRGKLTALGKPAEQHPDFPGEWLPALFSFKEPRLYRAWTLRVFEGEARILRDNTPSSTKLAAVPSQPAPSSAPLSEALDQWRYLFDGNTFSGWTGQGGGDPASSWRLLRREVSSDVRTILLSPEAYTDYELELEWKVGPRGNGGIFYHVQGSDQARALEMQLCDPANAGGAKSGGLYGLQNETHDASKPVGEWNTAKLVVKGSAREHWINGEKVCAYDVGSEELRRLAAASKAPKDISASGGRIALQANGGTVYYRNVRMRKATGAVTPAAPANPGAIDLAGSAVISRDAIAGGWSKQGAELHTKGNTFFDRLAFDVPVPPEYDFRIEFTRVSGSRGVGQHLVLPDGRDVMWLMGAFDNRVCTFELIDDLPGDNNPSTVKQGLENGRRYVCVVKVRRDRISTEIDGKPVSEIQPGSVQLSVYEKWKFTDAKKLGVGAQQPTIFHRIELIPVTAAPPADARVASLMNPATEASAAPRPSEPVIPQADDPRLAQLAAGFKARYETDAQKPFDTALAALNQSYVANGIGRARAAAQQKGALEEVTALDAEKARIQSGQPLPPADLDSLPESVKGLRALYRGALAKLESERAQKAAPLYDLYLRALDAYVSELTKADKLDAALKVKTLRDEIARQKPQVEAGPGPAKTSASTAPATNTRTAQMDEGKTTPGRSRWHEAARWVVSVGGYVNVSDGGRQLRVEKEADIPPGKFEVLDVAIESSPQSAGITDEDFTRLSGLKELRSVRLTKLKISDAAFAFLPTTPGLSRLVLSGIPVTDALIDHLAPLDKLTDLQIDEAPRFSGAGMGRLASLPVLTNLWFSRSSLTDAGLKTLAGANNLGTFRLEGSALVTDEGLTVLSSLKKLSQLFVMRCPKVRGSALAAWESPVALTHLDLSSCPIGADGVQAIARLASLTQLNLGHAPGLTDETLPLLAPLTRLTFLGAMGTRLSGTSFSALRGWTQLTDLALNYQAPITSEGLATIAAVFPNLERLTLGYGAQLKAEDFRCLTGLKALKYLGAPLPTFDDAALAEISRILSLEELYLAESAITSKGLAALKSLKFVKKLLVVNCKNIDDAAIPVLKDLKQLSSLEIRGTAISDGGIAELKKALPQCKLDR